ncbi:MAG TPA: hypothetical protein VF463_09620 [Sphingobium sp.]
MTRIATAFAALALIAVGATPALAAPPCKDAKGKFVKCPPKPVPVVKKAPCKDAKGKFIKCK